MIYILISVCLRTVSSFNITIIQVCAPTSGNDDNEVDHFCQQFQETVNQIPNKGILVVQLGLGIPKLKGCTGNWGDVCGPYCNFDTNEGGFRHLEIATFNNLLSTNTVKNLNIGTCMSEQTV